MSRKATNSKAFCAYYRVSTARQGRSGLGLEAQRSAVSNYIASIGGEIVAEFTEVESGKVADRPQLAAALKACRVRNATLCIAKLDRLSRDAGFLLGLQNAGVRFVAADMPEANEMVVGIMAVMAQAERRMIGDRTRAALAAARKRGVQLGRPENLDTKAAARGRRLGSAANAERATEAAKDLEPIFDDLRAQGATTLRQLADGLNALRVPAPAGGEWHANTVRRTLQRLEAA